MFFPYEEGVPASAEEGRFPQGFFMYNGYRTHPEMQEVLISNRVLRVR
jgi:hypothetical protein